ncbi:hypothetical protein B0T11DRAFT_347985, partial [Plectosphaerella cucumerina]
SALEEELLVVRNVESRRGHVHSQVLLRDGHHRCHGRADRPRTSLGEDIITRLIRSRVVPTSLCGPLDAPSKEEIVVNPRALLRSSLRGWMDACAQHDQGKDQGDGAASGGNAPPASHRDPVHRQVPVVASAPTGNGGMVRRPISELLGSSGQADIRRHSAARRRRRESTPSQGGGFLVGTHLSERFCDQPRHQRSMPRTTQSSPRPLRRAPTNARPRQQVVPIPPDRQPRHRTALHRPSHLTPQNGPRPGPRGPVNFPPC